MEKIIKQKKVNYLSNKSLLEEIYKSRAKDSMTEEFAKMAILLATNLAQKGCFVNYSYVEDMQGLALATICKTWRVFDPKRSEIPNPFAFFTQTVKNAFRQTLKNEKYHRNVRDALLISRGSNASYSYNDENEEGISDFNFCNSIDVYSSDEYDFDTDTLDNVKITKNDEIKTYYSLDEFYKIDPPKGFPDGIWFRYKISQGANEITGCVNKEHDAAIEYVNNLVKNANTRIDNPMKEYRR